jgi:hypothetical protein
MRIWVEGAGLRGPGLEGWDQSRPVLAGIERYRPALTVLPQSSLLPPNERRRTVQTVKLALAVGAEAFENAGRDPRDTATVFTSSGGDGETIHEILRLLAGPAREMSPTRFHNSVHNAPAGYWTIATRSHSPASSLCCFDASFAAGLLEAAVQATVEDRTVALVAYDVPYPDPLNSVRTISAVFGAGLILAPRATGASFAQIDLELRRKEHPESAMECAALDALRRGTPAARSLPLLAGLAQDARGTLTLDYVPGLELRLSLTPVTARAPTSDTGLAITAAR